MIAKYLSSINPLHHLNTQVAESTVQITKIKKVIENIQKTNAVIQKNQEIIIKDKATSSEVKINQSISKENRKDIRKLNTLLDNQKLELSQLNSKVDYLLNINTTNSDDQKILIAKSILVQQDNLKSDNIQDYEFKVFSQWGDDGIIQFLIKKTKIINQYFIEFGVQDYSESNTRFLLMNNNWSGLIIDGSTESITTIKQQPYYWKHDLTAIPAWITKKNINELLSTSNQHDIGLLHIDIDGNDYWIWKEIDISQLRPTIVIIEYNSVFGKDRAITIPYSDDFYRTKAHHSNLYFGASLKALIELSLEKGYVFIGCNSNGNNAYFIRKDRLNELSEKTLKEGYIKSNFRESRDENGNLTYIRDLERIKAIEKMPIYDIESNRIEEI